jgi:hypothetical protein
VWPAQICVRQQLHFAIVLQAMHAGLSYFATARFRCSGTRYGGTPLPGNGMPVVRPAELLQVGG